MKTTQECSVCGVRIAIHPSDRTQDEVLFSFGKPGNRARLFARVCANVKGDKQQACINQCVEKDGLRPCDFYGVGEDNKNNVDRILGRPE